MYENRVGCPEADAKLRVGTIDDFTLDASGEVFNFPVSGIMRLADDKIITKQKRAKLGVKPLWGGTFTWRHLQSGYDKFFWPVMSNNELQNYSVTEIFMEDPVSFPASGNIKIGSEIIHFIGIGVSNNARAGIGHFFRLAEDIILFDSMDFHETWNYADTFRQHEVGLDKCAAGARGLFAEKIGIAQIENPLGGGEPGHYVAPGVYTIRNPPLPPAVSAFMEEHFVGDDIIQVCVCDDSTQSDFPRYDTIRYSAPAGALTLPATLTGGWGGGTAKAVAHNPTIFLITVHSSDDNFRVPGEALTAPGFSCVIEEIIRGDGVDLPARNNPFTVLLQLLMSTGDGSNGEFDTLPDGWGLGFTDDMVDVEAIKALRDNDFSTTKIDFVLHEPTSFREFAEKNVFRFLQVFPFETNDGKYSIAKLVVEDEARELDDGSLFDVDEDHIDAKGLPDWTSGQAPVTKVKVKYNKDPVGSTFYGNIEINFKRSQSYYQKFGRTVSIESSVIYLSKALITNVDPKDPELPEILSRLVNPVWGRHSARPAPIVVARCPFQDAADVEVGDVVKVTHTELPNLRTGLRGLSGEYFQVMGVIPGVMSGNVEFILWQIGVHDNKYSRKAPSALVSVYAADTPVGGKSTITIVPTWFNRRYGIPIAERLFDRDDFAVGDEIMVMSPAWVPLAGAVPETATIDSLYDIVELATYDDNTATRKATRVFLADENRWLGAGNDSAFKYK
jgi:hypothetical protein